MIYTDIKQLRPPNYYPVLVTFDNGNSRIVHNDKDSDLLMTLLKKTNEQVRRNKNKD